MSDITGGLIADLNRQKKHAENLAAREKAERDGLDKLPTIASLCLARPLYDAVETDSRVYLRMLRGEPVQFDAFCTGCGTTSIFKDQLSRGGGAGSSQANDWMLQPGQFNIIVFCQRAGHKYTFCFDYRDSKLLKFGQMPSLEDVAGQDIRKYAPLLRDGYFGELKRATGLASHGIGIGSFVYLRRIFEKLISDHHTTLEKSGKAVEGFATLRMEDKIGALKDVLPPALVKNKAAYSILSSGIHALDEDTCRSYFPVVRAAIIEILEQDLRAREEAKAAAALEVEIARLAGAVKSAAGPVK
ncbi:hypothetical protein [Sphingomonas solaris]|uniref:Uncharacterized protein n=1 Tax=Alterirhizorhabdus solaris TaxID=2529389 RepID=A0A558R5U8_9SPHN|nr:hypothetical protein [Sphingomonas solaris]TVV74692.1 hypothetical protein FOY91_08995 [Sphingomonas solaris]